MTPDDINTATTESLIAAIKRRDSIIEQMQQRHADLQAQVVQLEHELARMTPDEAPEVPFVSSGNGKKSSKQKAQAE